MAGESDETVVIQRPREDSTVFHLPRDDEPRCGVKLIHGEWTTVPLEDVPNGLDGCDRCPRALEEIDDGPPSLLLRARRGDPEDFGLEPIPSSYRHYN